MNKFTRRKFMGTGLALLLPQSAFGVTSSDYDVVVVGAGAAGLAAARSLIKKGKNVILVEASQRIGGRAHTDLSIFGVPYDIGAHWLHNGSLNPYNKYAKSEGFDIYPVPENYRLFSGSNEEVDSVQLDMLWKDVDKLSAAIGKASKSGRDEPPSTITGHVDGRWSNTAKFVLGPWSVGKDFDNFSTTDWWNSEGGTDYFCSSGYGTLVAHYGKGIDVSLNTPVHQIDWSGQGVVVETARGNLKSKAVIITVSTGVLASDQIKFMPELPLEKRESFNEISMGNYDHIALHFSQDVFGVGSDGYLLFEIGEDGKGFGTLANSAGSGLAYCDIGGSWALELQTEDEATKVNYALGHLKKLLGSDIEKHYIKGSATAWGLNPLTLGSYASARPGSYKMRKVLRQPVGERVFFAGEACHSSIWATVGGAHLSGAKTARAVLRLLT